MLVLSRFKEESIVIGGDIEVKIVDVRNGKVKLGIDAPRRIPVHRKEIQEALEAQRKEALV